MKNLQELAKQKKGVTISEACTIIGISRSKMYNLLKEKKIKTFMFGSSPRIKYEEIENFLNNPE